MGFRTGSGACASPARHDDYEPGRWRCVVIAEGLHDPALVNELWATKAFITGDEQPLDEGGTQGRWHLYWVDVSGDQIDGYRPRRGMPDPRIFWRDDRLLVVYDDAPFELLRNDESTWQAAIEHGLAQGLRREWLDLRSTTRRAHWPA